MLSLRGVSAFYGSIQALRDVTIEVPEGSIVSIVGANGAGKSTVLKAIARLLPRTSGEIVFEGESLGRLPPEKVVSRGISLVPEGRQLFTHLKVRDNLQLGAYLDHLRRGRKAEIAGRLERVYALFPRLKEREDQYAGTLSGGEQQMVSIGRALMAKPRLLILDEPSMGLAPLIVRDIFRVIQDLHGQGVTILLVEQNARSALQISQFGYVLETGRVAMAGPSASLTDSDEVRKAYLGG
jgi:branched-chain amino acid transport system ATP-binding protein